MMPFVFISLLIGMSSDIAKAEAVTTFAIRSFEEEDGLGFTAGILW